MPHRSRFWPALLLVPLLSACGGGGSPTTSGTTITGLVSLPGAVGNQSLPAGHVDVSQVRTLRSWWTRPGQGGVAAGQRALGADNRIPGRYLVRLRAGLSPQSLRTLSAGGVTLRYERALGLPGLAVYRAQGGSVGVQSVAANQAVLNALGAHPQVAYAEPDRWMTLFKTPNDPLFRVQWDALALNLPTAWNITTGNPIAVAVVDSGVLPGHPDLQGQLLPGYNFVSDDGDPSPGPNADPTDPGGDDEYHGSHVTGTIAAATNNGQGIAGVSWGAKVIPVRAIGSSGGGALSDILAGVAWAGGLHLDGIPDNPNPARVINMSLGGKGACSQTEQQVFGALFQKNVVLVAAAGNDNADASGYTPASCPGVISVGAVGPDLKRAFYSNYGAVDVMAPGGNEQLKITIGDTTLPGGIVSTVGDDQTKSYVYGLMQGTSQAAPHVSGLVALLLGAQPNLTPAQVYDRLKAASTPLSDADCGVAGGCGAGLVDAARLLGGGSTTPAPAPTPTPAPSTPIKTYVGALYQLPQGFDQSRSKLIVLQQTSLRNLYRIDGLVPGTYGVVAFTDVNGDGNINPGEPVGVYPGLLKVDGSTPEIDGISIDMKPYQASTASAASLPAGTPLAALQRALKHR